MENYEKKYKNALEWARQVINGETGFIRKEVEEIFPELAESEDEKIRKALIRFHKSTIAIDGIKGYEIVSWLEKQESVEEIVERCKKSWYNEGKIAGMAEGLTEEEKYQQGWHDAVEKQVPVDKDKVVKGVRRGVATSLINYIDANSKGMCLSNIECEDIDDAIVNNEWYKVYCYMKKKLEKQEEKPQGKTALEAVKEKKIDNQNCVKSDDKVEVEHLIPTKGIYYTCIKDYYSSDNTHLCVKGNVYKSSFNGYIDDESHFGLSWTNSCAEKYFEPTKDEDWIVCEHDNVIGKPMQYKEFKKKVNQKFIENLKAKSITPKLRLWTVKDAKDADVLYSLDSKQPFIFKHRKPNEQAKVYCGINIYGKFFVWNTKDCIITTDKYIPATKEQRDTLLKAMADAGWQFDFEKLELKKIELSSAWSEEDKNFMHDTLSNLTELKDRYGEGYGNVGKCIVWLKSLKERIDNKTK